MQNQKTVFLIDDDSDDQEIFSTALKRTEQPIDCVFANDGIQALEKINTETDFLPDFIFIDLNMPRMNGQECLSHIKKIERLKDVPVYMYSTTTDPSAMAANKELGAVDFIVKPSSIKELTELLSKLLKKHTTLLILAFFALTAMPQQSFAQKKPKSDVSRLKKLSVEELMNIEVTSVSKTPQKLTEVASAIQVITNEDIKRSPTTLLPEVLRLAPNLQVTRSGSHEWTVTSRGFNGIPVANSSLADKLLVTVDGRAVYNPLFAGVYWDVQGILKDDIDRIEVVSGPGGTLWGANAVNGVINVISKSAKETQGFNASAAFGNFLRNGFAARYGSHIDSVFYFRIYGNRFDFNSTQYENDSSANDEWSMTKAGFRMDYMPSANNSFTLQGDMYTGNEDVPVANRTIVNGQNVLGKWKHLFSEKSNLTLQAYYDRTWRNIKSVRLTDEVNTLDIDLQHGFAIGKRNRILWGAGYRVLDDHTMDTGFTFTPAARTLELFSGFIQDQLTLIPKRLELTLGTKLLHNDYTQFEWQPSVRLAWTPSEKHTIWTAVSRAVRTPSRFDVDITDFQGQNYPAFKSEKVIAYELGYRVRPVENISFSLAGFYNDYNDLRSLSYSGAAGSSPLYFGNDLSATSWGIEFSGNFVATKYWRMRGGLTYIGKDFNSRGNVYADNEKVEALDPAFQAMIQSILDLPKNIEFDVLCRYVDKLDGSAALNIQSVPAYTSVDVRIGWRYKWLSLGASIQNLTDNAHFEFGQREIPRSIHGKIGFRF